MPSLFDARLIRVTILAGVVAAVMNPAGVHAEDSLPELFWGDTHVHSSYSLDANLFNNFTLGPETAYRFARG